MVKTEAKRERQWLVQGHQHSARQKKIHPLKQLYYTSFHAKPQLTAFPSSSVTLAPQGRIWLPNTKSLSVTMEMKLGGPLRVSAFAKLESPWRAMPEPTFHTDHPAIPQCRDRERGQGERRNLGRGDYNERRQGRLWILVCHHISLPPSHLPPIHQSSLLEFQI